MTEISVTVNLNDFTTPELRFWWHKRGFEHGVTKLEASAVVARPWHDAYTSGFKPVGRSAHLMEMLSPSAFVVSGGLIADNKRISSQILSFHLDTGVWEELRDNTATAEEYRMAYVASGRWPANGNVFFLAGFDGGGSTDKALRLNGLNDGWITLSWDTKARIYGHTITALNAGKFLQIGGFQYADSEETMYERVFLLDTSGNTVSGTELDHYNQQWYAMHTASLVNGKVYVIGGFEGDKSYVSDEVHTVVANHALNQDYIEWSFVETTGVFPARWGHTAAVLDDRIFVFGGKKLDGSPLGDLRVLDTTTNTWSELLGTGQPPSARALHTSLIHVQATTQCERLYVYGGSTDSVRPATRSTLFTTNSLGLSVLNDMRYLNLQQPRIVSITSNDCIQQGKTVVECADGGILTVRGDDFDRAGSQAFVGAVVCMVSSRGTFSDAQGDGATTYLTCTLPPKPSGSPILTVRLCGETSNGLTIGYQQPEIFPNTLRILGDPQPWGTVAIPAVTGGTVVEFDGRGFGSDASVVRAFFGPPGLSRTFECAVDGPSFTSDHIQCTLPAASGQGYVFSVEVEVLYTSDDGVDTLSFPVPLIFNNTLELLAATDPPSNAVLGRTTEGEDIAFNGQHFGDNIDFITVKYGPVGVADASLYDCLVQEETTSDRIVCRTSPGTGPDHVFRVTVGPPGSSTGVEVQGTDTYTYPNAPTILTVQSTGCVNGPTGTTDCPTRGDVEITVTGTNFAPGMVVTVGGRPCLSVTVDAMETSATCQLPAGAGLLQQVVASLGAFFSRAAPLLSYSLPTLTDLIGCTDAPGQGIRECAQSGGELITLHGDNFGQDGTRVLVGGLPCVDVQPGADPHTSVTCKTPAGTGLETSVIVLQPRGEISAADSSLTLSYKQCLAGTYLSNFTCIDCGEGRYSSGSSASACTDCLEGRFQDTVGSSTCKNCPPGKFAGDKGSASCTPCAMGQYTLTPSKDACDSCPIGRFGNTTGLVDCFPCESGGFADVEGLVECLLCPAGKYSDIGSDSCVPCPPGSYSSINGSDTCEQCPADTATSAEGSPICQPCASGKVSGPGQSFCQGCELSQYLLTTSSYDALKCEKCPFGAVCSGGTISSVEGFWLATDNEGHKTPLRCTPGACMAGQCGVNRIEDSVLCGKCAEGHYEWGGECIECSGYNAGLIATIIFAGFAYLYVFFHITQSTHGETKIFLFFVQMGIVLVGQNHEWTSWMGIFDFDVLSRTKVCIAPWSPLTKLFVIGMIPFFSMAQLGLVSVGAYLVQKLRGKLFHGTPYVRTLVGLFVFSYNSVTISTLAFFNCRDVPDGDGTRRLATAPSVDCSSSEYVSTTVLAIVLLMVFVVGIPFGTMAWLVRLHKHRKHMLSDRRFRETWGVLFDVYTERHYLWEIFSLSRRVVLIAVTVIWSQNPAAKYSALTLLLLLFYIIQMYYRPYTYGIDNQLEAASLSLLLLLSAVLSTTSDPLTLRDNILVLMLFVVPAMMLFGYLVYARVHNKLGRKLARNAANMDVDEDSDDDGVEMSDFNRDVNTPDGLLDFIGKFVAELLRNAKNEEYCVTPFSVSAARKAYKNADEDGQCDCVVDIMAKLRSKNYFARSAPFPPHL